MNLTINDRVVREAALINLLEIAVDSEMLDRIRGELWCLREGIDTTDLADLTLHGWETSFLVDWVVNSGLRNKHDASAFLLCTIHELS